MRKLKTYKNLKRGDLLFLSHPFLQDDYACVLWAQPTPEGKVFHLKNSIGSYVLHETDDPNNFKAKIVNKSDAKYEEMMKKFEPMIALFQNIEERQVQWEKRHGRSV